MIRKQIFQVLFIISTFFISILGGMNFYDSITDGDTYVHLDQLTGDFVDPISPIEDGFEDGLSELPPLDENGHLQGNNPVSHAIQGEGDGSPWQEGETLDITYHSQNKTIKELSWYEYLGVRELWNYKPPGHSVEFFVAMMVDEGDTEDIYAISKDSLGTSTAGQLYIFDGTTYELKYNSTETTGASPTENKLWVDMWVTDQYIYTLDTGAEYIDPAYTIKYYDKYTYQYVGNVAHLNETQHNWPSQHPDNILSQPESLFELGGYWYITDNFGITRFDSDFYYIAEYPYGGGFTGDYDNNYKGNFPYNDKIYVASWKSKGIVELEPDGTTNITYNGRITDNMGSVLPQDCPIYQDVIFVPEGAGDKVSVWDLNTGHRITYFGDNTNDGHSEFYTDCLVSAWIDRDRLFYADYAGHKRMHVTTSFLDYGIDFDFIDSNKMLIDDNINASITYIGEMVGWIESTFAYTMYDTQNPTTVNLEYEIMAWADEDIKINAEGILSVQLSGAATYGPSELVAYMSLDGKPELGGFDIKLSVFDTGLGNYAEDKDDLNIDPFKFNKIILEIDYIWVESQEITHTVRSQHYYTSVETMIKRLEFDVYDYRIPVTINVPNYLQYSSISPSATVTQSGNVLNITNTIPTIYEVIFTSTTGNYYPTYKTSGYYFINPGFENGWYDDWQNTSSDEWTVDLTTNIVFTGSRALNLTSPSSVSTYCSLDSYVYPAEYIFTFAYYRTTTSPIYFYWWENDEWQYEALETDTNIWIRHTGKYNITGDTAGYNIAFVTSTTDQNIIIDEFNSWEANGEVRTIGYYNGLMETGMFATMRNIDLYDNPAVPYHPVSVILRDRTADAQIIEYLMYCDEYGRIHLSFVLPDTNQMNEMEYTFRIQSLITGEYIDSYFTPIPVNHYDYFMVENSTNFGLGGIDFTEVWDDGATYYQSDDYQSCGYNRLNPSSATVSDFRVKFFDLNDIDASYYTHLDVTLRTNVSDLYIASYDQEGNLIGQAVTLPQSAGELDWYTVTWNISADDDWSGIENGTQLYFDEVGGDGLVEENNFVWIDQIRLYHIDNPWLVVTATYGYLTTEYNQFAYYVIVDGVAQDYVFDLDPFLFDLSQGSHEINVTPFLDLSRRWLCYIPTNTTQLTYDVAETGIMKIIYHDQSGYTMDFDMFKTYIDNVRLYEQYAYFLNTSLVFNLTVTDIFDNIIYQDTTESFEYFKEIQITLYSIKLQNQQEFPIWIRLKRGDKTFSEAIFPFEIIEFKLESDTYDVRINYTYVNANKEVVYNGTYVTYQYTVTKDTAIFIVGTSIQDVFNNVVQVAQDIDNVNASLSSQMIDVDIHITNINTSITDQVVSVEIYLDNVNTSLGSQLVNLGSQITNLDANITVQFTDINSTIINVNSTIFDQTVNILSDLDNVNSTIYSQTLTILSDISNTNSTLYDQTVNMLSDISNMNSTIYSQTVTLLSDIQNMNTTIYDQTVAMLSDIENVNSTIYSQTVSILSQLTNNMSVIYDQTVTMLSQLTNNMSTIYTQTVDMLSNIENVNSTLYSQTVSLLSDISNMNTTIYDQTVTMLSDISNMNSTIYSQTVTMISNIENVNSTIYQQTVTILSQLTNNMSTIYSQTVTMLSQLTNNMSTIYSQTLDILSDISNTNSTIYSQTVTLLSDISNMNSTIYSQTVTMLSDISNMNTTIYDQTVTMLSNIGNVNSTIYQQTVSILSQLTNNMSVIYEQTLGILSDISNINSTLYSQTVTMLSQLTNNMSTIYSQSLTILSNIENTNTTIYNQTVDIISQLTNNMSTIYTQTLDILSDISNVNSTIYSQTIDIISQLTNNMSVIYDQSLSIISDISNTNSTLYSQTINIISQLTNNMSVIYGQTISILSDITNVNSTLHSQTVTILSQLTNNMTTIYDQTLTMIADIVNTNSTIYNQTVDIMVQLTNNMSVIYSQTVSILSNIVNVNSTLYSQTVTILSSILNVNTTLYAQTVSILSNIQNVNSTIYSQTVSILSDISNMNSTIYSQTISILSDIQNMNSTIYTQTIEILSDIQNTNTTIFNQTIEIISTIQNTNTTLFNQNLQILSELQNVNSTIYNATLEIITIIGEMYGIYRVHFSVVDGLGIGLPFETILLNVNGSRQFDQDVYMSNGTYITTEASDWFSVKLWAENFTIYERTEINITIKLYEMFLFNNGNYTAYVEIYRNNHLGLNITVPVGQAISFRVTSGTYDYKIYYYEEEIQNINTTGSPAKPLMSWGKKLLKIGQFTVSAKMPKMIDVSTPTIKELVAAAAGWAAFLKGFLQGVTIAAVGGAVAGFIVFTVLKEGWIGFKVGILRKAPGDSLIKPDILERKEDELEQEYLTTHKSDSRIKY